MKILIPIVCLFIFGEAAGKSDRIKLKEVQVLTLRKGAYTQARRSPRVPQLACVGGSARCAFIPETVQCYNRGWDGTTVNWECKADMDKKYSFGKLEVTCEGYDHPDDSYILAGSCGLEFTINIANGAYQEKVFRPPSYAYEKASDSSDLGFSWLVSVFIVLGALFFFVYLFRSPRNHNEPSAPPPPPGFRPDFFGGPPPYDSPPSYDYGNDPFSGPSHRPSKQTQGDGPGFGTGFFLWGSSWLLVWKKLGRPKLPSRLFIFSKSF